MNLLSFDVESRRPRGVSMVALSAGSDHNPYTPIPDALRVIPFVLQYLCKIVYAISLDYPRQSAGSDTDEACPGVIGIDLAVRT